MRFFRVFVISLLVVGGCSRQGPEISKEYPLSQITGRVYMIQGPNELPSKSNQAFMNNPGFVVTGKGVVVVDPGSSVQVGRMVLRRIASVTREPVVAVFNTHIHGDHWLGNQAIHDAFPKAVIYAHPKMISKTAVEGEAWVKRMDDMSGGAVRGTVFKAPDLGVEDGDVLALGGMHFQLYHTGVAHTDGDLMVEVVEEKVFFLGDNATSGRAQRMDDGNFKGNIEACDVALKTTAEHFIPGHGPANGRAVVTTYQQWLKALYASVKKYQAQGLNDFEMKEKVVADLKDYRGWVEFSGEIGKLISLAYLQSEQESF